MQHWSIIHRTNTYLSPTTAGDERLLYGQGRPMAYLASGGGANWATGLTSDGAGGSFTVESRFEFSGTVAPTDLSRATDAREKGRIGITGTAYAYAGASGRVTSEALGRDLNPLGRGDGRAYVAGGLNLGQLYPALPQNLARPGTGNSVSDGTMATDGGEGPTLSAPDGKELIECESQCPGRGCKTATPCNVDGRGDPLDLRKNPCCGKGYVMDDGGTFCDCIACIWNAETRWCEVSRSQPEGDDCNVNRPDVGSGGGFNPDHHDPTAPIMNARGGKWPGGSENISSLRQLRVMPGGTTDARRLPVARGKQNRNAVRLTPVLNHQRLSAVSATPLAAWDPEEIAELIAQILANSIGQGWMAELGISMKDLACCLGYLGISYLENSPSLRYMEYQIQCFILCRSMRPIDLGLDSCDDCEDPETAYWAVRGTWEKMNEDVYDYLTSESFIEALKECAGASGNPISTVL